jgi:hypothetical protein
MRNGEKFGPFVKGNSKIEYFVVCITEIFTESVRATKVRGRSLSLHAAYPLGVPHTKKGQSNQGGFAQ